MLCVLGVFSSSFSLGQVAQSQRAQQFKATHEWTDPLTVPLVLSGNFGELRGNHFHTGLDMKTQGREGLPVLASTDGQLARVKMAPWGYGNALYLEGPDGITTVYAHLQRFAPEVQAWAVARTYKHRENIVKANPVEDEVADEAIRCALTYLKSGELVAPPKGGDVALRYLRDRVNVPRDMSIYAARRMRTALERTAALAGDGEGPPIPVNHRRDQDPRAFR